MSNNNHFEGCKIVETRLVEFIGGPYDGLLAELSFAVEHFTKRVSKYSPHYHVWYRDDDYHLVYLGYDTQP